jgi:uncharacterized membrane protein YhaH (DUF805 family)
MNWYLKCFDNYATFTGRARRKEYWTFALVNGLALVVLGWAEKALGLALSTSTPDDPGFGWLSIFYSLVCFIPGAAVAVRRLQDTGRNGRWLYLGALPVLGGLVLLLMLAGDSQPGPNKYGPNPKEVDT